MINLISNIIIGICLFALFTSILINFVEGIDKKATKEKRSIVETGTMTLFFVGFYLLIRFQIGTIQIPQNLQYILILSGLTMIVAGCTINIVGRLNLGKNWANQIKIYQNHTLTKTGMYNLVRHPLYASLMMMFIGSCLVYSNYLAFLAHAFIFIPFMYYRAKQEEKLLSQTFIEYKKYQKEVGMFFPKFKLNK
ncbi:MAG: isoprenylcysteine carboxylmethyltransferase family protein [Candidatus Magasanikbacteria bacterium]